MERPFDLVCEIEPALTPDLRQVRHQVGVLSAITSTFLVPDNHIGRATVSSVAVAHEVVQMGGTAIACLNARDRNTLGFRRDLLTAAAYGVDRFLFVYGDRPESGRRSDDLTVRAMVDEARTFSARHHPAGGGFTVGVASRPAPLPEWKQAADFLFAQVSFSVDELVGWRRSVSFAGPVYAGVMVLAGPAMARKLTATVPQLAVPPAILDRLDRQPSAGVDIACEMLGALRDSGLFDGAHLVAVRRYREVAQRLEREW